MNERLTEKLQAYVKAYKEPPYGREVEGTVELLEEVSEKLAEYEDLEEQGLLAKLPFHTGSPIWDIDFGSPCRYKVTGFSYGNINEDDYEEELPTDELIVYYSNFNGSITGNFSISEIGKTIFLTQSEAEEKLRELEGANKDD